MKPLQFDVENCSDLLTDTERREIGDRARKDAETGLFFFGMNTPTTYWSGVVDEHRLLYYTDCFNRRVKRMERKNGS